MDADPDDRFGDFESMMHLYACVGWLASLHDWPCASSLCTSDEPAPTQFPRPKMFNVDLSLALPLTVSDLRGVALRASRSVALPPVCHGFHEPSRACPRRGSEAGLPKLAGAKQSCQTTQRSRFCAPFGRVASGCLFIIAG